MVSDSCVTYSYDPCQPSLSAPTQVFNIDPAWSTCVHHIQAFYDPPYILTPGGSLSLTEATGAGKVQGSTPSPQPGAALPDQTAVLTTATSITSPAASPATAIASSTSWTMTATSFILTSSTPGASSGPSDAGRAAPPDPAPVIIAGQSASIDLSGNVLIGSNVVAFGAAAITINDIPVSLGSAGVVIGSTSTIPLNAIPLYGATSTSITEEPAVFPAIVVGSETITADSNSQYIINSQTLMPGGKAVTFSGTMISLASSGNYVNVNGVTSALVNPPASITGSPVVPPAIVVGSETFSANANSQYIVNSQTLVPGGNVVTISGITISLATAGNYVDINGATSALVDPPAASVLTVGSQVYVISMDSASDIVLGSQTLRPNEVLTMGGEILSLDATETALVVVSGTTTETIALGAHIGSAVDNQNSNGASGAPRTAGAVGVVDGTTYTTNAFTSGPTKSASSPTGGASSLGREMWVTGSIVGICIFTIALF